MRLHPSLPLNFDQRLTIRGRLVLLVLALAIPFAGYLALSTWRQATEERGHAGQQMLGIARVTSARLDDYIGDVRQMLTVLAQVVDPVSGSTASNEDLLRRLQGRLPPEIDNVSVWNAAGRNVGLLDKRVHADHADVSRRPFFLGAIGGSDLAVEAPIRAAPNGEPVAVFAMPIERDGKVVGVIAAATRLMALQKLLSSDDELSRGAVVTVFDASGLIIARSLDSAAWIGKRLPASAVADGVHDGRSADGVARIGGFTTARRVPWKVYVGIPTQTALQVAHKRVLESGIAGLAVLVLGLLGALRVGQRISSPLIQLGHDAAALERGDLGHRSPVRQGGEIGSLARSVNRMADTLQERATALLASQAQLREITNNLPVLISYIDPAQRFRFANSIYRDWIGLDPEGLIGKSLGEVYGAAVHATFRHHIERGLAGHRVTYERVLQTTRGPRQVEVTLVPHFAADGGVSGIFVLMQDVTDNREAVSRRLESEERLSLALEGSGSALFDWDIAADRLFHSAQAAALRGDPAREEVGTAAQLRESIHPDDRDGVIAAFKAVVSGRAAQYDAEFRVARRDGGWVWLRGRGRVVERRADGHALRLAGTYSDITPRKLAEERLQQLAQYDSLTGLPNRALFHDRLDQALARNARSEKATAVLFLDIDHFKQVNDTLGHEAGDHLLKDVARGLRGGVRLSDTVARLAGDEFTIILEGLRGPHDAEAIAAELVARTRRSVGGAGMAVRVSASIGIAMLTRHDNDAAAVLRRADAALYSAKRGGRDRYALAAAEGAVGETAPSAARGELHSEEPASQYG